MSPPESAHFLNVCFMNLIQASTLLTKSCLDMTIMPDVVFCIALLSSVQ